MALESTGWCDVTTLHLPGFCFSTRSSHVACAVIHACLPTSQPDVVPVVTSVQMSLRLPLIVMNRTP